MAAHAPERVGVLVIGAGPAGCSAAIAAARRGACVVLVERHRIPRYKVCGGGLIGLSLSALPAGFCLPERVEASSHQLAAHPQAFAATLTRSLGHAVTRASEQGLFPMVMRDEFDGALAAFAQECGVEVRAGVSVESVTQSEHGVLVQTRSGSVVADALVGADGSTSRVARHVGTRHARVDLGLEAEIAVPGDVGASWQGRVLLDFGTIRGGYAWIFPKGSRLTVGAIAARGRADEQRAYLNHVIALHGLDRFPVEREGGHLTRCREVDSPLGDGRILLAGDAAGLLEPWTREGISFALRSGSLAGAVAADIANGTASPATAQSTYAAAVSTHMGREMDLGFQALSAYERHPAVFHQLLARTSLGWRSFQDLCRGDATLAGAGEHRIVRQALRMLAR